MNEWPRHAWQAARAANRHVDFAYRHTEASRCVRTEGTSTSTSAEGRIP